MSPAWSVVIPTFDRAAPLAGCLAAFAAMDVPAGGFEVVVVDDGGDAALDFVAGYPFARLIRQANAGPAAARNRGAAEAAGARLAFTDDDCHPAPGWLTAFDAALEAEPAGARDGVLLGGETRNGLPHNRCSAASQDVVAHLDAALNHRVGDDADDADGAGGGAVFFASNNIACTAAGYRAAGGFPTGYRRAAGEDRAFCRDWIGGGGRLVHAPAAVMHHHHRLTLRQFWRQHHGYGAGAHRFHAEAASSAADDPVRRQRFGELGFYAGLIASPFTGRRAPHRLSRSALLLLSQVATVAGYAGAARAARQGGAAEVVLPGAAAAEVRP